MVRLDSRFQEGSGKVVVEDKWETIEHGRRTAVRATLTASESSLTRTYPINRSLHIAYSCQNQMPGQEPETFSVHLAEVNQMRLGLNENN